jgi:outer membrane lipoprotein-sorting protein
MVRAQLRLLICICSIFYSLASFASDPKLEEALSTEELREVQSKLSRRSSLRVDFVQVRTSALRPKKPSKSSGKALFARPARFRWELEKPLQDVLIFDGNSLFSYKPGDKTATKFATQGERSAEIKEVIDFVMDFDSLMKRYKIVKAVRRGADVMLSLSPNQDHAVAGIDIAVNGKTYYVQSLKMSFINKNSSEFVFSNPTPASVTEASFQVPPGMKIVDGL